MQSWILILLSVAGVSLVSLLGILLFSFRQQSVNRMLFALIGFSTGAMLGDVFLHMIPEMAEEDIGIETASVIVLGGIVASFILEKYIHWRHCHAMHGADHHHPVSIMNLFADGLHNFLDGILIAGSFLVSVPVGVATTMAVLLHEIPQEISDFSILLYGGFTRGKALFINVLFGLTAVLGALLVLMFKESLPQMSGYLLPFAAGNFLYIAASDLIPELHKETSIPRSSVQLFSMFLGISLMWSLTLLE